MRVCVCVCVFFVALDLVARTQVCGGDAGAPPLRVRKYGAVFLTVSYDLKVEREIESRCSIAVVIESDDVAIPLFSFELWPQRSAPGCCAC